MTIRHDCGNGEDEDEERYVNSDNGDVDKGVIRKQKLQFQH